jgi:chromosome segregation ATPase
MTSPNTIIADLSAELEEVKKQLAALDKQLGFRTKSLGEEEAKVTTLNQQLAAKDALLIRLKEDFEWYKSRSHENRFNYRRAVLSIAAIDKELVK